MAGDWQRSLGDVTKEGAALQSFDTQWVITRPDKPRLVVGRAVFAFSRVGDPSLGEEWWW